MRSWVHLASCVAVIVPLGVAGQGHGILLGRVLSQNDEPLAHAQVWVENTGNGALTDETGAFRIPNVPAGRGVVRVELIGYGAAAEEVSVPAGDSIYVSFRLSAVRIRIDGAGHPFPEGAERIDAESLLPVVLRSFREEPASADWLADPEVVVWIPWMQGRPASVEGVPVRSDCAECWRSHPSTVEGGRRYSVAARHLRLGAYWDGPGHLVFCLDPGEVGDVLMANCNGSGRTVVLRFREQADGEWRRVAYQDFIGAGSRRRPTD